MEWAVVLSLAPPTSRLPQIVFLGLGRISIELRMPLHQTRSFPKIFTLAPLVVVAGVSNDRGHLDTYVTV
jgi:hypothetical protein